LQRELKSAISRRPSGSSISFDDRIRQGVRDELAADVEVAREPAQRQAIHHRQRKMSGNAEVTKSGSGIGAEDEGCS
jgi:hypothetical protein